MATVVRLVHPTPELKAGLIGQLSRVKALERKLSRVVSYLFSHLRSQHKGQRVHDFTRDWPDACRKVGISDQTKHELRHSAVRSMVNRGVPEKVEMQMIGHRTWKVSDRYHTISPGDLRQASRRLTEPGNGRTFGPSGTV